MNNSLTFIVHTLILLTSENYAQPSEYSWLRNHALKVCTG